MHSGDNGSRNRANNCSLDTSTAGRRGKPLRMIKKIKAYFLRLARKPN